MTVNPFVFLVGCPRSGTTLLRRMVDAHPAVAVISEMGWVAERWEAKTGLTPDGRITPGLVEDLISKNAIGRYTRLPASPEELRAMAAGGAHYAELVSLLFDRYGDQHGKRLVGNKTVDYVRSIPTLHRLWPGARFVHLVRDGRDVALSALAWRRAPKLAARFATWSAEPVATAALWWDWHVRLGRDAARHLPPGLYHEMRYEALVADPEAESERLCAFLGVAYDDAMVRFHEGRPGDASLGAKHGWLPPTPGLRDWRSQMSPDDAGRFEAVAGDLLAELGYPVLTPTDPGQSALADELRARFEGQPRPERWRPAPVR